MPSLKLILIILSFIATLSSARPITSPEVFGPGHLQSEHGASPHTQRSRRLDLLNTHPPSTDIKAVRMLTDVSNPIENGMISRIKYTKLGTIIPIMVAAQTLEAFYESIAAMAYSQWLYTPETHEFIITQGRIQLSFICSSADVPWDFVAAYARMMAENVANGWVDIYDSVWTNPARTIGIEVALRLKDAAGL